MNEIAKFNILDKKSKICNATFFPWQPTNLQRYMKIHVLWNTAGPAYAIACACLPAHLLCLQYATARPGQWPDVNEQTS